MITLSTDGVCTVELPTGEIFKLTTGVDGLRVRKTKGGELRTFLNNINPSNESAFVFCLNP